MDQNYCILCPGLAREYNSDLGVDHWTLVKIILSRIRICFSIMEVIKEFVVKVTSVQTFSLIQKTLNLNLDTDWKWEQLARVAPCRALLTYWKHNTCVNT